jgi:zinc/manganese transport system substrate-binding protein
MDPKVRNGLIIAIFAFVVIGIGVFLTHKTQPVATSQAGTLQVVAGENFWGSIASQIGGTDAHVVAIVSDPNADPHDYESTTADAKTFADANYVILNGVGYDSWGDKLIAGNPNAARKVLDIGDLVGKKDGDNPHIWYNPAYVNQAAKQMEQDMASLDPAHASDYEANYQALVQKLSVYQSKIQDIQQKYPGAKVAATEDIFVYLATATGLNLVSPPEFTEAVAEGNDPPAQSVATFQDQLKSGQVKVLVYNEQTDTPLTENVKKIAEAQNIPVVGITETVSPANVSFEDWMDAEVTALESALAR